MGGFVALAQAQHALKGLMNHSSTHTMKASREPFLQQTHPYIHPYRKAGAVKAPLAGIKCCPLHGPEATKVAAA